MIATITFVQFLYCLSAAFFLRALWFLWLAIVDIWRHQRAARRNSEEWRRQIAVGLTSKRLDEWMQEEAKSSRHPGRAARHEDLRKEGY